MSMRRHFQAATESEVSEIIFFFFLAVTFEDNQGNAGYANMLL